MKCITILLFLFIPLFSFSQDVLYKNGWGHYIGTEKVTKKEFKQQLAQNPEAFRKLKRAKTLSYTGIGLGIVSVALFVTDTDENRSREKTGIALIGYSTGLALSIIAAVEEIGAINTYNSSLNPSTRIAPTSNGIGLVYQF